MFNKDDIVKLINSKIDYIINDGGLCYIARIIKNINSFKSIF